MAERTALKLVGGTSAEGPRTSRKEPMAEGKAALDRYPIWVHFGNTEHARHAFLSLKGALGRGGLYCDSDLQTDPHEGLTIEAFFEVFRRIGEKRSPEHVGIVTLFSDEAGNRTIKINPSYPEACEEFRAALSSALEGVVTAAGSAANVPDVEITVRQQNRYQAPESQNADGEGQKGA